MDWYYLETIRIKPGHIIYRKTIWWKAILPIVRRWLITIRSMITKMNPEFNLLIELKKMGFVDYYNQISKELFYRVGFVKIVIKDNRVFIGHDVAGNELTLIKNPSRDLKSFVTYFNRI